MSEEFQAAFKEAVEKARKAHKRRMTKRNHLPRDVRELLALVDENTGPDGEIYGHRDNEESK